MGDDELPAATDEEIFNLELARADRFLDQLRDDPWVVVAIKDGRVRVFKRSDISIEHLREIREALSGLIDKE
jgi:hypothetical protein